MAISTTTSTTATAAVTHIRAELKEVAPDYTMIDDCVGGERVIKRKGTTYLPKPNPTDVSEENVTRYLAYKTRAVFYNVAQRTLSGLVGEVFVREPVAELPTGLDVFAADADGRGLTLTQLAKRATRYTLSKGRAGILTDYPAVADGTAVSKADIETGEMQPTITVYDGLNVINWRTARRGSKTLLILVVLKEKYDDEDDGFAVKQKDEYRVLRLEDGVYTSTIYRDGAVFNGPVSPTDHKGKTFDYIPFTFIGSENNDPDIDHAPMVDLASINVAHYRNSADYEEGVYMVGQPTPVFSGLTQEWVENVMKGEVRLGSRGGVMLPENGSADLLQMEANTAAFEAMQHKERQMVALGAKLVEQKEVQRTATEADIENSGETSILADVAKNVSAAIRFALEVAGQFTGDDVSNLVYELNTDFSIARMSPQERQQLISEWQQGAVSFSEMRAALRKSGAATLDDADALEEIEADDLRNDPNAPDEDADPTKDTGTGDEKDDDEDDK